MTQTAAPSSRPLAETRARLRDIIRKRSFGFGEITLASGRKSNFYFNLKPTMLDAEGAALLAELTLDALSGENIDYVGGLEMGAVPLAGAIAQLSWIKGHPIAAFFVRKKPKEHGARLAVEGLAKGETLQGKRIVIVEDVTTTGGSALSCRAVVVATGPGLCPPAYWPPADIPPAWVRFRAGCTPRSRSPALVLLQAVAQAAPSRLGLRSDSSMSPRYLQSSPDFAQHSQKARQRLRLPRSGSGVEISRWAGYCRMKSFDFSGGAVSHSSYWCSCKITTMRFSSWGLWKCLNSS